MGNLEDRAKAKLAEEQLFREAEQRAAATRAAEQRASEADRQADPRRREAQDALRELVAIARKYRVPSFELHRARAVASPKWKLFDTLGVQMIFDRVGSAWVFGSEPIRGYFPATLALTDDCRIFPFIASEQRQPDGRPTRWPRYLVLNRCGVACRQGTLAAYPNRSELQAEGGVALQRFAIDPLDGPDPISRMSFFVSTTNPAAVPPWAAQQAEVTATEMLAGIHRSPDAEYY